MPSSQKFFYARPASAVRRSAVMTACLVIGITGFVIGFIVNSRQGLGYECKYATPKRVSVVWDTSGRSSGNAGGVGNGNGNGLSDGSGKRYKVMGFVGIYTGFESAARRRALRQTWLPSDHQGHQRLEEATGLVFKFVIGRTSNKSKMSELRKEIAEYDDVLSLDIEEEYSKLPYKILAFFRAAYALYDSDFYVKADDNIYLRPDRLSLLLAKERPHLQTYVGCMKKGPVVGDPKQKWYEPMSYMLGKEYFIHAYGPIYALSAEVVASLVALRNDSLRTFSNEDVTIGAWMLAMNVKNEDNRQLCEPDCTPTSIAVWDIPKCSGLCEPEKKLLQLHEKEMCSKSPTQRPDDDNDDDY